MTTAQIGRAIRERLKEISLSLQNQIILWRVNIWLEISSDWETIKEHYQRETIPAYKCGFICCLGGHNNRQDMRVKNWTIAITKLLIHYYKNKQRSSLGDSWWCGVKRLQGTAKTRGLNPSKHTLNPGWESIRTIIDVEHVLQIYTVTHCCGWWRWILRMRTFRLGGNNTWGCTGRELRLRVHTSFNANTSYQHGLGKKYAAEGSFLEHSPIHPHSIVWVFCFG